MQGNSGTPHDPKTPWEIVYCFPESDVINDRQYKMVLKILRYIEERLKKE